MLILGFILRYFVNRAPRTEPIGINGRGFYGLDILPATLTSVSKH